MLSENCPEATATQKILTSFIEQSGTPRTLAPVEPESSVQICPFGKSQLNSSLLVQEAGGQSIDGMDYSSDSDSGR